MLGSSLTQDAHSLRSRGARLGVLAILLSVLPVPAASGSSSEPLVGVIVRASADGLRSAATAISQSGGAITRRLPLIGGFAAEVPASVAHRLEDLAGVESVSPDGRLTPMQFVCSTCDKATADVRRELRDEPVDSGAMSTITRIVGAQDLWSRGITGRGVDVALIDTGVAPVPGLQPSQIVNGADLSFDSQSGFLYTDAYGHGTHMAGIIAGRDDGVSSDGSDCAHCLNSSGFSDPTKFVGVAPEARIVNVKVGAFDGAADVSQVIAAIDWVVQHRNDNGLNIRVLNLSFGTDSLQSYVLDPLAFAVEAAWRHGVFVVAASGNDGAETEQLAMPAADPFILAVGAENPNGTLNVKDDTVPEWAQRGTLSRRVDVVAPGVSVASLDVPGSFVNETYPTVHTGRFLRGSGTSQAAAVASGVAALMFQRYPDATPDQVKKVLVATSRPLLAEFAGYRVMDARKAASFERLPAAPKQPYEPARGTGSLEESRGSMHVADDDADPLYGEQDIFGSPWDGEAWSALAGAGTSWSGGSWNGNVWTGDAWDGLNWTGTEWTASMWNGQRWSGQRWSRQRWSGQRWSGDGWDGQRWSESQWDGQRWSRQRWSGQRWSGQRWSGQRWSGVSWS